jgi:hypothetical protein
MIEVTTEKNEDNDLHVVISWKAISKTKMISPKPLNIWYIDDTKVLPDFLKNYQDYFVDNGFLRLIPKHKQLIKK